MSNFDDKLRKELSREPEFDAQRAEIQLKETVMTYVQQSERQLRIAWRWLAAFIIVSCAGMAVGNSRITFADNLDTKRIVMGLMMYIGGGAGLLVSLLWYWLINSRLLISREIKELQLQVSELAAAAKKPQ